jgi:hypothetical protein
VDVFHAVMQYEYNPASLVGSIPRARMICPKCSLANWRFSFPFFAHRVGGIISEHFKTPSGFVDWLVLLPLGAQLGGYGVTYTLGICKDITEKQSHHIAYRDRRVGDRPRT